MILFNNKNRDDDGVKNLYTNSIAQNQLPKDELPDKISEPRVIRQLIHDELFMDGNARQNLATFCTTYIEDEVRNLMDLSINKNMIDKDEYPQTAEIEHRCVNILANLGMHLVNWTQLGVQQLDLVKRLCLEA